MHDIEQVLEEFRTELLRNDYSSRSVTSYLSDIRIFIQWATESFGGWNEKEICSRDVIEFRHYMLSVRAMSAASTNRRLAAISRYFRYRCAKDRKMVNPCLGVKSVAIADPAPRAADPKQLKRLLREVHVHGSVRDIAIVELLCNTAARVGEIAALVLSDLDISERKGTLRIRHGKGRTARVLPLNIDARHALTRYLAFRPASENQSLFLSQRGGGMTTNAMWRVVKKYAALAGYPEMRVHDIRHHVLREICKTTSNLATVMKLSGHRDAKTLLARYAQPTMDDLTAAVDSLAVTDS